MNYHKLRQSFEWYHGIGRSDALHNGPYEALNFMDMFPFKTTVQDYTKRSHFPAYWFKLAISMHVCNIESTLQVYLLYLPNPISNVFNVSVSSHTSCGKHYVLGYGVEEHDSIAIHEIAAFGELLVNIKNIFKNNWYRSRLHM